MKKIINPCKIAGCASFPVPVFCEIEYKDGKLSIHGVIGPKRNGDAWGSCGQIDSTLRDAHPEEITLAPGWDAETFARFLTIWDRWHLNDLRAGCEHQRANWDVKKELKLTRYAWATKYHELRKKAENGKLTAYEYAGYCAINERVTAATIGSFVNPTPKYETPEIKELLAAGWIKAEKTETKAAGWVYPSEHPEGVLTKPCPVCGYKYGTAWKKEDVPQDVIDFLASLPETTTTPAWV